MSYKYRTYLTDDYYHGSPLHIKTNVEYPLAGDSVVEDYFRVTHIGAKPKRYATEPIFTATEVWEGGSITSASVMKLGDKLVMWYTGAPFDCGGEKRTAICYAESDDGIHFVRPSLGRYGIGDAKDNNIILLVGEKGAKISAVQLDSGRLAFALNDGEAYSVIVTNSVTSFDSAVSVEVTESDNGEFTPRLVFDEASGKWQMSVRPKSGAKSAWLPADTFNTVNTVYTRRIAVSESSDLVKWSPVREVYMPDRRIGFTEADSMLVTAVGETPYVFIGHSNADYKYLADNRHITPYLAFGRNVSSFALPDEPERAVENGEADAFDEDGVDFTCGPLNLGDGRDYFYYIGFTSGVGAKNPTTALGLMSFEAGRYSARTATKFGGWLVTREFYMTGCSLEIDADVPMGGEIKIELMTGDNGQIRGGRFIDGRRISDCDAIVGKNGKITVTWQGDGDLSFLKGRALFIRFSIKNAKLYGFTIKE